MVGDAESRSRGQRRRFCCVESGSEMTCLQSNRGRLEELWMAKWEDSPDEDGDVPSRV